MIFTKDDSNLIAIIENGETPVVIELSWVEVTAIGKERDVIFVDTFTDRHLFKECTNPTFDELLQWYEQT